MDLPLHRSMCCDVNFLKTFFMILFHDKMTGVPKRMYQDEVFLYFNRGMQLRNVCIHVHCYSRNREYSAMIRAEKAKGDYPHQSGNSNPPISPRVDSIYHVVEQFHLPCCG